MPTQRSRSPRSARPPQDPAELRQLQRWLDDGGAEASDRHNRLPVTWSPVALNARLEAQRAAEALGHRSWVVCARARSEIKRITSKVDARQLDMGVAIAQLRALTKRLEEHRFIEETRSRPRGWQLLRERMPVTHNPIRHRVLHTAVAGPTYGRGMTDAH